MGIQINGTTDTISAVDGSLDINQNATFGNNVTIGGTLTYSDVTNIDSVGLVTAKNGLRIHAGGLDLTSGISTFSDNIQIADKIIHKDDTDTAIRFPSVNTFSVETAGTEKVRITSAGKVGINTTNPGAKLSIWADDSDTDTDVFQIRGKTGAFNIRVNDADASNPEWAIRTYSSEPIVFMQATVEKARIASDGKVGINESSPLARLHVKNGESSATGYAHDTIVVEDSDHAYLTFLTGTSGGAGINFGDSGSAQRGVIEYAHSSDYMRFITAQGERLRIKSNGDVGIGTDSPGTLTWRTGHTLDVFAGAGNAAGQLYLGANRGDGVQTVGSIVFYDNTQTSSHQNIAIIEVDKIGSGTNTRGGDFLFYNKVAGGTSAPVTFKIRSGGNCEIPNGNLIVADGHGIEFSAVEGSGHTGTSVVSVYEVGTWTPAVSGLSGVVDATGRYIKIGDQVTCAWYFNIGTKTYAGGYSSTQSFEITGLPYACEHGTGTLPWYGASIGNFQRLDGFGGGDCQFMMNIGDSYSKLFGRRGKFGNNTFSNMQLGDFYDSFAMHGSITYRTA